jgi:hypothetical protein
MNLFKAFSGFLVFALGVTLAFSMSGSLLVKVTDENDQPLPGATVLLTNKDKLTSDSAVFTKPDGQADFPVLLPGPNYAITVSFPGYATQTLEDIKIGAGPNPPLVFKMIPESALLVKEKVTAEREVVDVEKVQSDVTFSSDFLTDIPIQGREYQQVLRRAPAIQDEDQDGNPNVKGSRDRDFKAMVDGISNVDPLTGRFMSDINPDAIEEIEIITGGAGAEYSRAQGGFAKIITKQGSNEFAGTFNFYYRSHALDGNGATDLPHEDFSDFDWFQPSVSLSGAIIKDKLFWAVNHEYFDRGFPVNTLTRGIIIQNNQWKNFDKLTWQVTGNNKLVFQYSADPYEWTNLGVNTLTPPESGYMIDAGGPTFAMKWQATLPPKGIVTSLVAYSDTGLDVLPMKLNAQNDCASELDDPIFRSAWCFNVNEGETSGPFYLNWHDERQRFTAKSDMEYFVEKFLGMSHRIKAGFIIEDERYYLDYLRRPTMLIWKGNVKQEDPEGNPEFVPVGWADTTFSFPESFRGKATGTTGGLYIEDSIKPIRNLTFNIGLRIDQEIINSPGVVAFDPIAEARLFEQLLLEQCHLDWQRCYNYLDAFGGGYWDGDPLDPDNFILENPIKAMEWTVTVGDLAYNAWEAFTSYEDESGLAGAFTGHGGQREFFASRFAKTRKKNDFQLSNTNVAPRLGFSWDPWNKGKAKIFGTYGRYYDKIFYSIPLQEQFPVLFNIRFGINPENGRISQTDVQADSGVTFSYVDKDIETPYMDEITLGFETEIATETSLKLSVTKREYKNQLQDIDLNHFAADYGPNDPTKCNRIEGTIDFQWLGDQDGVWDDCTGKVRLGAGVNSFGQAITTVRFFPDGLADLYVANPFFNQIFLIGNYNESTYKDFTLEIIKRRHHHWELEASYVYSIAKGQAEDYNQGLGDDPTTLDDEVGYLSIDQRHVVKINSTMEVPIWNFKAGLLVTFETGLPYSILERQSYFDSNSPFIGADWKAQTRFRTTYPTRQRNDQRNEAYWTFDIHLQKDIPIQKTMVSIFADIFNILNEDRLRIFANINQRLIAERRFGRQWQIGFKLKF